MLECLIVVFLLFETTLENLIKNGDFEYYANLPFTLYASDNSQFHLAQSDINCWYDQGLGPVEFKQIFNATTVGVDLSSTQPMTLCQNVMLEVGFRYNLSFEAYTPLYLQDMYVNAYLNSNLITSLYIETPSTHATERFSSFCFNQTHITVFPYASYIFFGGVIDNISLVTAVAYINFEYVIHEIGQILFLRGNCTYNEDLKNGIESKYDISLSDKIVSYAIKSSNTGQIQIQIKAQDYFRLESVKLIQKIGYIVPNSIPIVYASVTGTNYKYFYFLQKGQIQLLTNTKNILIFITGISSTLQHLSQTFFFTYLINMIIDAQFTSLLYIFTQIQILPDFTRKIYHEILYILFFSQNFFSYSLKLFNIPVQLFEIKFQDQFNQKIYREKNQQIWFGFYGFTSKVIKGNANNILILFLSLIKLCSLKLLFFLISRCFPFMQNIGIQISAVFLMQFCYIIPFILIPLSANILNSVQKFNEKIYSIFCILIVFQCLICLFLQIFVQSFLWKTRRNKKERNKNLIMTQKIQKISQLAQKEQTPKLISTHRVECEIKEQQQIEQNKKIAENRRIKNKLMQNEKKFLYEEAFVMPMLFFIPILSFFANGRIFLIFTTFTVITRFFNFIKQSNKILKFTDFLLGLIWMLHHCVFVVMIFYEGKQLDAVEIQLIINLGIIAVFTIVCIVLLQILKILIRCTITIKNSLGILLILFKSTILKQHGNLAKEQKIKQQTDIYFIKVTKIDKLQISDRQGPKFEMMEKKKIEKSKQKYKSKQKIKCKQKSINNQLNKNIVMTVFQQVENNSESI